MCWPVSFNEIVILHLSGFKNGSIRKEKITANQGNWYRFGSSFLTFELVWLFRLNLDLFVLNFLFLPPSLPFSFLPSQMFICFFCRSQRMLFHCRVLFFFSCLLFSKLTSVLERIGLGNNLATIRSFCLFCCLIQRCKYYDATQVLLLVISIGKRKISKNRFAHRAYHFLSALIGNRFPCNPKQDD